MNRFYAATGGSENLILFVRQRNARSQFEHAPLHRCNRLVPQSPIYFAASHFPYVVGGLSLAARWRRQRVTTNRRKSRNAGFGPDKLS